MKPNVPVLTKDPTQFRGTITHTQIEFQSVCQSGTSFSQITKRTWSERISNLQPRQFFLFPTWRQQCHGSKEFRINDGLVFLGLFPTHWRAGGRGDQPLTFNWRDMQVATVICGRGEYLKKKSIVKHGFLSFSPNFWTPDITHGPLKH